MIGRRDLIKLAAGGAVGTGLTPAPWKLLDDTAIWSQNWSWVPKVPRGELKVKYSTCTLCPGGCGVRATCVAGRAVALAPVAAHPLSRGVLCPVGLVGHTAAYHSRRVRHPLKRTGGADLTTVALDVAMGGITKAMERGGRVAILDLGPRRAMSAMYADVVKSMPNAQYVRMPDREESTLNAVAARMGRPPRSLGLDLENTRTLISFGAPVLDGWATPGRVMQRWRTGELKVMQVEPRQSRTALAAHDWIAVAPGTEAAFACAFDMGRASLPAVAIAGGDAGSGLFTAEDEDAIVDLNIALNAIGTPGGIISRTVEPWEEPAALELAAVPSHSVSVLFIDASRAFEAVPWPLIRRTLVENALVVALAYKHDNFTAHADIVLPVAAPFETLEDAGTPPCSAVAALAVSQPLIETPEVRETAAGYFATILGKDIDGVEATLKQRAAAIHESERGRVISYEDGTATAIADIGSADDLYAKLGAGGCWLDDPSNERIAPPKLGNTNARPAPPRDERYPLTLVVHGSRGSAGSDAPSPLFTKLYQESGLYATAALVRIHPDTAGGLQLKSGQQAAVATPYGAASRTVLTDPAVMPGVIEIAAGPGADDITNICTDGSACGWRAVPASVRRS